MKSQKNLIALIAIVSFVFTLAATTQASGAWTKKEISQIKKLEKRIEDLEQQLENEFNSQEFVKIRFLASEPSSGIYSDVCPGIENLEGGASNAYIGRLSPKTDIFGRPSTDLLGREVTQPVYRCELEFVAKLSK